MHLTKKFTVALIAAMAASGAHAKEQYGKHFIDYMHGAEHFDQEALAKLLPERRAAIERGENVEPMTIHLVPHTHDDIGWLKTIDEYYSGTNMSIAIANVSKILDTVIAELILDQTKVFTYVEMKFFSMWFYRQTETMQEQVRQLVKEKRLTFINAGWSMHDEACTHYDDMINNMMIGHEFLLKEFDYKPTIGWHIDPFGHSNANPRLFADMGFDTFIFGRLDYEDREQRLADKSMQYVWKPFSKSLGDSVEIFTHVLQDMYWFPADMGYDERDFQWSPDPVIDDETLETFNADTKTARIINYAIHMQQHYRSHQMFIPWGEDFAYGNAFDDFSNGDALLRYFNKKNFADLNIDMRYSTVQDYVDSVKAEEIIWPTKYDDMFPYADSTDQYWTGYFTSRANSKSQIRFGQHNLHASEKLFSGKVLDQSVSDNEVQKVLDARLTMLDSMGSNQHHDAVTGTAKQHVSDDYAKMLSASIDTSNGQFTKQVADYTEKFAGLHSDKWAMCSTYNSTYTDCPIAQDTEEFAVTSYNPTTVQQGVQTFKVPPMSGYTVDVFDYASSEWQEADSTLLCYDFLENNAEQSSYQDCNLHVKAEAMPHHMTFMKVKANVTEEVSVGDDNTTISTSSASLSYTGQNEAGSSMFTYTDDSGDSYNFDFGLQYYNPSAGDFPNVAISGAYVFVPELHDQVTHLYSQFKSIETHQGSLAGEFAVVYADDQNQAVYQALIRLGEGAKPIEFEVQMLEIPLIDDKGMEVVAKWNFDGIDSQETFYTDSNGLEMQTRVRNFRPDFTLDTEMTASDNYYPINQAIVLKDATSKTQVTVMNQHSQGGSSLASGSVELMQNRRLTHDDNKGVTDPLNETQPDGRGIAVNTKYWVTFADSSQASSQRETQLITDEPLQFFYTSDFKEKMVDQNMAATTESLGAMASQLTSFNGALKLLQFPEAKNQVLIRLENLSDLFDGTPVENPTFDLNGYATSLYKSANGGVAPASLTIQERTLGNNMDFAEMKQNKFKWLSVDGENPHLAQPYPEDVSESEVTLQPQRIRLFRVTYTATAAEFTQ